MTKLIFITSLLCILSVKVHMVFAQGSEKYFSIRVIDQKTGRGVPLVEFKTTNNLSYFTDNNGIIAFYEPGLMNQEVYFHIKSHGYEYPVDGFGYRGESLLTVPGDSAVIKIDRTKDSRLIYNWKINTEPLNADKEKYLFKKGELKSGETWLNLCDFVTGDYIMPKSSSVFWNEYRRKWVMVFEQIYGTSYMGEVWYAEGDTPTGPWVYARKIVTHDNYTFYNVGQHPLFDQDNGRLIYFEGTYTDSFSGNPVPTPRYNYNQIMYRLDLNDPRLYLPPDRKFEGLVPVYAVREKGKIRLQVKTQDYPVDPLFYGLPDSKLTDIGLQQLSSPMVVPLYEYKDQDGFYSYSIKNEQEGLKRSEKPVCRVWKNPSSVLTLDYKAKPVQLLR